MFSAIVISNRADAGNEAVFYAHSIISRFLLDHKKANVSSNPIADKVTQYWRNATNSPAFFRSPRITVPSIVEACNDTHKGLCKIALILLAAYEGVNLVVDDSVIEGWKQILRS
jgi:hypothetical protein